MAEQGSKLKLLMVVEVLGSPKEHVEKAMKAIIEKLENDKSLRLISQTIYKAEEQELKEGDKELLQKVPQGKKLEEEKLWSTFADIELETTLDKLSHLCFDYMPSSIEILEPEELRIKTIEVTNLLNDLQATLHKLDRMVKDFNIENMNLKRELQQARPAYKMVYKKS